MIFMGFLEKIIRKILLTNYEFWLKFGVQVIPDHFYYPIPSKEDLTPDFLSRKSSCLGIDWNIEEQNRHLNEVFIKYIDELDRKLVLKMMSPVDALIYYAMIRHYRPSKIIEIGGGESTRIAAFACLKNKVEGHISELICIEPYPNDDLIKGFDGLSRLVQKKVQEVELKVFQDCDLLFIDSSHVVKMGNDVVWEILEIIPILKKGCLIHWHDIFIPEEYPEYWVRERLFWSEQYMVQTFFMYNYEFEIIWATHFMNLYNKENIKKILKDFTESGYPLSSFWARRKITP